MTAAAERAALGAIGTDLLAVEGGPGERRAARLVASVTGSNFLVADFGELKTLPGWTRWPRAAQRRLAQRVALASIADAVAGSIDGAWLGQLAKVAGDDALDWATTQADRVVAGDARTLPPERLEAHGAALLASQMPHASQMSGAAARTDECDRWIAAAMKVGA